VKATIRAPRRGFCDGRDGRRGNVEDKRNGKWYCWHHAAEAGLLHAPKPKAVSRG
jgi:hypothetical protein